MRLLTFSTAAGEPQHIGALITDGTVLDLTEASVGDPMFASLLDLIDAGDDGRLKAAELLRLARAGSSTDVHRLDQLTVLAPIPRPRKNVFCVGLNYRSHVEQNAIALGQEIVMPEVPLFFSKPVTAVIGPDAAISHDVRLTEKLDYEVELAVVIGKAGTWINAADADDYIYGYTIANDVSARDLQFRTGQFLYGKGLDTYCPLGPVIATTDEIPDLSELTVELLVNGEVRQSETAGNMIFTPAEAIAWLSQGITLEPGDIITLGTPGGCGYQLQPPRFLTPGDVVECRVNGLGSLTNPVQSA